MLEQVIAKDGARLIWSQEDGVGFLEVKNEGVYDEEYFQRYREMSQTPMAIALNGFRADLVRRHGGRVGGAFEEITLLDVGIGDGAFLRALEEDRWIHRFGADVNPAGIAYLEEHGQLGSLEDTYGVVTFWDSLEHIRDPRWALRSAASVALVSIPIFADVEHVLASRHFRPDEHYWYFTRAGFIAFAKQEGFDVVDVLATETALGRDGIETFVLNRRRA